MVWALAVVQLEKEAWRSSGARALASAGHCSRAWLCCVLMPEAGGVCVCVDDRRTAALLTGKDFDFCLFFGDAKSQTQGFVG